MEQEIVKLLCPIGLSVLLFPTPHNLPKNFFRWTIASYPEKSWGSRLFTVGSPQPLAKGKDTEKIQPQQ